MDDKLTKEGLIAFFKHENIYNKHVNKIVYAMINEELDSNNDIIIKKIYLFQLLKQY